MDSPARSGTQMGSLFSDGLFFPALTLAFLAWLVPKLLSLVMPEGIKPLMLLALLATLILFAVSAAFFVLLYIWNGTPLAEILAFGWAANIVFFGRLGLIAAMIWAPIMILTVATLPRHWIREKW
jgi:hypothetical protein